MTVPSLPQNPELIPYLYILNRISLKASGTKSKEELIFLIVNDTLHLIPYNRALLFSYEKEKPKVIGVSGETTINENSPLIKTIEQLALDFKNPKEAAVLTPSYFKEGTLWNEYQKEGTKAVLWLPIFSQREQVLGLWLEQVEVSKFAVPLPEILLLLRDFLMHAYGIAWERLSSPYSIKNWWQAPKKKWKLLFIPFFIALALLPIPLRIVAPCEVISSSPYVIRSPLNGVVKKLFVLPGQFVKKDDPLLVFDAELLQHALESAKELVNERKLEFDRSYLLGMQNKQALNELNLLQIKLQKEKINLNLAEYEASLLTMKAPQEGIVILDSPDEWRGHPVSLGDKIMTISDPYHTQIKIWIPESDNVPLDTAKAIKIYLNVFPSKSYQGKIHYIANESSISPRDVPSYEAKADWLGDPPKDVSIGLKGSAILYGDSVPLFYYIIRKPWFTLRNFIGF